MFNKKVCFVWNNDSKNSGVESSYCTICLPFLINTSLVFLKRKKQNKNQN